jgi:rhodanese-related sulfurtransferase
MPYQDLLPKDFLNAYKNSENAVLIDVRTPAEIEDISIEGHLAIDIQHPSFIDKMNDLDKSKNYFVYCRSGNRSGQACKYMSSHGFSGELYNLKGGMLAWVETDFED